MASAPETHVSQECQDRPIVELSEDSTSTRFVFERAEVLSENVRLQGFTYMADKSAHLLHGNKILKQILSEITKKCDEKTANEEMQKYMYSLVLWELLKKCSIGNLAILALILLQKSLLATMEYLVPYSEAIKQELQPEKIAIELKAKLHEYTRWETDGEGHLRSSGNKKAIEYYEKALAVSTELGYQLGIFKAHRSLASVYFSMAQYEKAIVNYNECLTVSVKTGKHSAVAGSNEHLGHAYFELENYKESLLYLRKSLHMYTEMEDREGIASSSQKLGLVYFKLGKYEKSIDYCKKSLDMYTKLGKREEIASNNLILSTVYCMLGQNGKYIDYCKKSLDMCTELGNPGGIAFTNQSLGEAYFTVRRYEEASRHFEDSLAMYTRIGDQLGIATINKDLGRLFKDTNQPKKAMGCFKKSIAINTEMGNQLEIACGNAHLGDAYRRVGEYEKAITHTEIAITISGTVNDKSGQASYCRNLADTYIELQQYEKAEKALKISTEIGDRLEMARSNASLGSVYLVSEKYEKAIECFATALAITTDIGNQNETATIIGNMANVYLCMGQLEKAADSCKRSLALGDDIGNQSGIAANIARLGNIYLNSMKFEEAVSYFEKVIEISRLIGDQKFEGTCLVGLGKCYYLIYLVQLRSGLEPLKRSISYFRKSIECFDSIFLNLNVDENQTSFTNQYVASYVDLKRCFISLKRFETALLVADLGKAKTLQISIEKRSNVADYARKTWQAIDDEKEKDHISDIAKGVQLEENCATVLYYSFDTTGILNVWLFNCDHGNVNISIPTGALSSKDYIHTSVSKLLNAFNLSIDRGSSFFHSRDDGVDVEKLLLQESISNNRLFRNETGRSEMTKQDLKKVAQSYDLAVEIEKKRSPPETLENLNIDQANIKEGGTDSSEHLRNLFLALIRPIQEFVKGTKLIIIPDGFLFFVPFSALLDGNGVYLSENYSIQITPSLHTLYSRMLDIEPVSLGPALFVGNPTVGDVRFEGEILNDVDDVYSLPNAAEEVTLLASRFHARPLTGSEATKSRVLDYISDSSIIHIAAHGDKSRGEIFLAPNPEWIERGFDLPTKKFYLLQERDIISMDIKARLVVLSCCTTGRGKISSEGVIGLARSFHAAGAQSVLATLWKIPDNGTKFFMENFYDKLLNEVSVCEALKATMNVFQHHQRGFYRLFSVWAPFTMFGKDVKFTREDIEEIKWKSREISL